MTGPILCSGIFPLGEKLDDSPNRWRLTARADLLTPSLSAISQNVKEGPFEEDVMRKSDGVSASDMLQNPIEYELIN